MAEEKQKRKGGCLKSALILIGIIIIFSACIGALGGNDDTGEDVGETSPDEVTEESANESSGPTDEELEERAAMTPDSSDEETVEESTEEQTTEEENDNVLDEEDVSNLRNGLSAMLNDKYTDISIHSFEYEDNRISAMIDMQKDPLPAKIEAEDIIADVTWYLAEMNEVVDTSNFYVTAMLVSDMGDGELIHWLTDRWDPLDESYETTEQEAFEMLN